MSLHYTPVGSQTEAFRVLLRVLIGVLEVFTRRGIIRVSIVANPLKTLGEHVHDLLQGSSASGLKKPMKGDGKEQK